MGKRGKRRAASAAAAAAAKKRRRISQAAAEDFAPPPQYAPRPQYAPQPRPLKLVLGERASTDRDVEALTWTCECGTVHLPRRGLIADIPVLRCDTGVESDIEFDFSIGNVMINDQSPIIQQNVKKQMKDGCTIAAASTTAEITLQMQHILAGEEVNGKELVDMDDLKRTLELSLEDINKENKWDVGTLVTLAIVATHLGVKIDRGGESKIHIIPGYVQVTPTFYDIVRVLADAQPLMTVIITGKKFKDLKPGQIYKAPQDEKLIDGKSSTGHAIVLIGAGRRRKTNYYHFINTWGDVSVWKKMDGTDLGCLEPVTLESDQSSS